MDTRVEVDETRDELVVEKKSLLGRQRTEERIPLSRIEEVCVYSRFAGGRPEASGKREYVCELSIGGSWEELTKGRDEQDVLRAAAVVGRRLENRPKKMQELADHLSKLFRVTAAIADEASLEPERHRQLSDSIWLRTTRPHGFTKTKVGSLMVDGIVRLHGHDIDSVEVLHTGEADCCYLLGYIVGGGTVGSIRTNRAKDLLFGHLVKVEWKGASFSNELNSDVALEQLLLSHLRNPDCDAYITTDLSGVNTMIIFGDSYPRQWVRLPSGLFPTETRARAVTLLARKIRSSIR